MMPPRYGLVPVEVVLQLIRVQALVSVDICCVKMSPDLLPSAHARAEYLV